MGKSFLPPDWRDRLNQRRRMPRPLWLRVAAWISVGSAALTLFAGIAFVALMNNPRFHSYLLRTVETNASKSLGVRVQLQNFTLHMRTLSADLYGVTVDGAAPYPDPPLLQVEHIEAGVRVVSILHRAWYFDDLRIDHPVVHIFVDYNGVSNIPAFKSSGNSSSTSVFDLGIRHALLDKGELYFDNKPTDLDVDLRDLEIHSSFNSLLKEYSGKLAYSDGRLVLGSFQPLTHNLNTEFKATPTRFDLNPCKLIIGDSHLDLSATLQDYSNPNLQVHYDATVDGAQVAKVFRNPFIPSGTIRTTGSMQYQEDSTLPAIDSVTLQGDLSSLRLDMKTSAVRGEIANLTGHYSLANAVAKLSSLHANLLGGEITAQGTMKNVGGNSQTNLNAALRGVSLADLTGALGASASQLKVTASGKLNADATASWGKTFDDLVAHTDATVNGQVSGGHNSLNQPSPPNSGTGMPASSAIPIESMIHATYSAKSGQLSLDKSYLHTPQTDLTMDGAISTRSKLNLQLQAHDLREVETISDLFRPSSPEHPLQPLGLAGEASFLGTVQGSTAALHLIGQLTASNLQFKGTAWKVLRTHVDVSPSLASLQQGDLEPASHGRIAFSASTGLSKWLFTNTSPIQIELEASHLDIAELTKLADPSIPIAGTLNAGLKLHGTELSPVGTGSVTLTDVVAYDQPIHSAKLEFSGDGAEVHSELSVQLPAGNIQGKGSVRPGERTYTAEITADGIQLNKLQALRARNVNLTGMLSLNAKGQGSFDNPQLSAAIQVPTLVVQSQTVSGLNLQMNVADHSLNATINSSAVNTNIRANAKVELTGDYLADASLDTQGIPLQPLLAVYAPDQAADVTGQTEVHATLHGPLKKKDLLEAHVNIPVLKLAYGDTIQLAAASPIRADYKNGIVDIQRSSIRGTDTELEFQGSIPTTGNGPMSLMLVGTVNLQLAQLFDPDVRSSGQVKFNIDSHGPATGSELGGQIDIVDANFASADLPVGLQHGNGVLKLTKDRVNIASFQAMVGGGTLTAQGGVTYQPTLQFNLGASANGVRILYPQGMSESVDANLRLAGTTDNSLLAGSVNLSDVSFTPAFDLDTFIGQFSGSVAPPPTQGLAQDMRLNIAVHSTNNVNLVSRTLSIGGTANLQVRGSAAEPVILGRVNLNDGDIILNGNRFVLNGGTIQFVNPSETQPVVNLTLNTNIQQYSINLRFNGPVEQLRTEYSSDPALPSADIINLLAFGETTEASAAAATPANQAAESVVASQVSSQVTSRVSKIAGISQLSISPVLAGSSSQGPPGAVVTIQQRVTGNLFVNYSTNVASTQSQTIQGQYRISPRVSLSATRDPNGGFAFDALIKKKW